MSEKNKWLIVSKTNRYKCVHCGKVGYSAGHMRKHSIRCTANPDRKCGMHYQEHLFDGGSRSFDGYPVKEQIQAAIHLLPDPKPFDVCGIDGLFPDPLDLVNQVVAAMPSVIEAVGGCPACTLAALRQRKIPYMQEAFNFKAAVEKWKDDANRNHGHRWQ